MSANVLGSEGFGIYEINVDLDDVYTRFLEKIQRPYRLRQDVASEGLKLIGALVGASRNGNDMLDEDFLWWCRE